MEAQIKEPGPGMDFFSSWNYRVYNVARLQHLASLNLPLSGRVLEVGSGPGDHTGFYLERGCTVVATDAREECIREVKKQYPQVEVRRVNMNDPEPLAELGIFDVVHCYGLLYHLEEPERAIAAMSRVCGNLLLVETCVSAGFESSNNSVSERIDDYTQALRGRACRPTRRWVFDTLKRYFPFVYQTRTQPIHREFPTDWTSIPAEHGLIRAIFVAAQKPYDVPTLSPVLLEHQETLPSASPIEVEIRDAALEELRLQLERSQNRAVLLEAAAADREAALEAATEALEASMERAEALDHAAKERLKEMLEKEEILQRLNKHRIFIRWR